jgi:hypothetical protein
VFILLNHLIAVIEQLQLLTFFRNNSVQNWHLLVAISIAHLKDMLLINFEKRYEVVTRILPNYAMPQNKVIAESIAHYLDSSARKNKINHNSN